MKLTYHKNIFTCVIILISLCSISIFASDINSIQQSIANTPAGSDQWQKLYKKYFSLVKNDPPALKQALAFCKNELEKKYSDDINALLWEYRGELEQVAGNHTAAVWSFTNALNIYDSLRLQTKNKTWPKEYVTRITPLSVKRQQSFKRISRSSKAEENLILEAKKSESKAGSNILQAYASYITSGNNRKFETAKKCLSDAIILIEKNNIENSAERMASIYNTLAFIERRSGNIDRAEQYLFKALTAYEKMYGKNHLRVGSQYGRIGDHYSVIKDYKNAEIYKLREIEYYERTYGSIHRSTGIVYSNMGIFYSNFDHNKALFYFQKAVETFKQLYSDSHPDTIERKLSFVRQCIESKEYAPVKDMLDDCLDAAKLIKNVKKRARLENIIYRYYSDYYFSISDFEKSLSHLIKAEAALDDNDNFLRAHIYKRRAVIFIRQKKFTEALEWAKKATEIFEKYVGRESSYTKDTYKHLAEIHYNLNNSVEAEIYERLAAKNTSKNQTDIYAKLGNDARNNSTDNESIEKNISLLKQELSNGNQERTAKLMFGLISHAVNSAERAEKITIKFDFLENELRQKKQFQEQIIFLKTFSHTGFSELFPEHRKNYFGNLEDILYEEKLSIKKQLQALTVLASDYLRNEAFFADGKEHSSDAITLAVKHKHFSVALKLYQMTLRRLMQFDDDKFASIYSSAQKTADTVSDAKFKSIFNVIALLEQLKSGNGSLAIESLKRLYSEHPQEVSEEIISFLEYNPQFLSENKVDVLSILGCVSKETIAQTNPMLKRKIAAVLLHQNKITEAKQWYAQTESAFERLLYLNTSADDVDHSQLSENFKLLEKLKPEAFELNNKKYSASDMSFLIWLTKCKYAKSLSDNALLLESAKQVDVILNSEKCSKDFISLLQIDTLTALFDYNYLLGDFQQAKEQIEKILAMKGYDAITRAHYLMRHGMCCLALKENKNAANHCRMQVKFFITVLNTSIWQ
ncbi:MAG: tetratricopeptide repeat-containing protein [Lentisphaeria bacterium]|nr:tetratricopeptide repeat-containing protein [Lentisphaeria bacterium]